MCPLELYLKIVSLSLLETLIFDHKIVVEGMT